MSHHLHELHGHQGDMGMNMHMGRGGRGRNNHYGNSHGRGRNHYGDRQHSHHGHHGMGDGMKHGGGGGDDKGQGYDSGQWDHSVQYTTVDEVVGNLLAAARDQNVCRFLQKKFDEGGHEVIKLVFPEVLEHSASLMMDPFGNYLIQKLLDRCSEEQRLDLVKAVALKSDLVAIALNTHGTRAVQKLVETLSTQEQSSLVIDALKPGIVLLIKDLNGNHVVQRCLQRLGASECQFIYDAAGSHCVEIATHRHGCCVLQRCIDHATPEQRTNLVKEIAQHAYFLSQDPFGNYVVQYVLDIKLTEASEEVMKRLAGHYAELSAQKFSSNVVEKCLKMRDEDLKPCQDQIVQELADYPHILRLLQDPYANYVVQSALSVSSGALYENLVEQIKPYLTSLRGTPHGKRIMAKINNVK